MTNEMPKEYNILKINGATFLLGRNDAGILDATLYTRLDPDDIVISRAEQTPQQRKKTLEDRYDADMMAAENVGKETK